MNSLRNIVLGGAMALVPGVAAAADMPRLLDRAPIIEEFGGWYLRGDIGMTNQRTGGIHNVLMEPSNAPRLEFLDKGAFDSGWLFGVGVGYQFNSWVRADLTGEYRGKTSFHAMDRYDEQPDGVWDGSNTYDATKSEWVFLLNAYIDLGTWWSVTPFVGAGIGAAQVTIDNYRDHNVLAAGGSSMAYAAAHSQWNLAWALHAGLSYRVTPAFTVELAYRYLNLGDGKSGDVIAAGGANNLYNPTTFKDLDSHDVKLAMRWSLGSYDYAPPPPVVRKY